MRLGEVIGGLSLAGLVVVIGLALNSDDPEAVSTAESVFVWNPSTTDAATAGATSTTDAPAPVPGDAAAPVPASTTSPVSQPTTVTEPATPAPTTTGVTSTAPRASTTLGPLPETRWSAIRVRVLNGGADEGAGEFVSGALKVSGFEPRETAEAGSDVQATVVLYREGRRREALSVNEIIDAPAAQVVEAPTDDVNWQGFGNDVDVLVVLGPPIG